MGDYTGPMTYRLSDIYIGCYISLSNVLTDSELNGGKDTLADYNTKKLIFISIFKIIFLINRINNLFLNFAMKQIFEF